MFEKSDYSVDSIKLVTRIIDRKLLGAYKCFEIFKSHNLVNNDKGSIPSSFRYSLLKQPVNIICERCTLTKDEGDLVEIKNFLFISLVLTHFRRWSLD